ncbi:MAG: FAD-dependent oxidoreductase, partial [Myxococcota bacterium]
MEREMTHTVIVVGAGPAGLYASKMLCAAGCSVILVNRDIRPGGLAEYGIYWDKFKMKAGLRKQFAQILAHPLLTYIGNVRVGNDQADITLEQLDSLGANAILVATGAQGVNSLGLPGEMGTFGVYHAKDLVYHYNGLPPFSECNYSIGKHVGIVGMGNVMVDVAHWLICEKQVLQVTVFARRGPGERAYTDKEMREVVAAVDTAQLAREFA